MVMVHFWPFFLSFFFFYIRRAFFSFFPLSFPLSVSSLCHGRIIAVEAYGGRGRQGNSIANYLLFTDGLFFFFGRNSARIRAEGVAFHCFCVVFALHLERGVHRESGLVWYGCIVWLWQVAFRNGCYLSFPPLHIDSPHSTKYAAFFDHGHYLGHFMALKK